MPLFFILSGISSYYSLGFRKAGEYIRGRFKRLMIPLIFGFGLHYCNFNNKFLAYANEAVLPFYILHQTLIVTIAFCLIGLYIPVGIKYFMIASTSKILIERMETYDGSKGEQCDL